MLSPIVILVFAPVVLGGIALFALLLGSAAAGALEAIESRPKALAATTPKAEPVRLAPARAA